MKHILLFLIISSGLVCVAAKAQVLLNENLTWKIRTLPVGDEAEGYESPQQCLFFEGCAYTDPRMLVPHYSTLIDLSGVAETMQGFDAGLTDVVYEPLTEAEQGLLPFDLTLPDRIEFTRWLSYSRKRPYLQVDFLPFRMNPSTGQPEKVTGFTVSVVSGTGLKVSRLKDSRTYAGHSVLTSGNWVRIGVATDGIYRLTYNELKSMGIENPAEVRVFGYGGGMVPLANSSAHFDDLPEIKIRREGEAILFFAQGPVKWNYDTTAGFFTHQLHAYSDYSYYYLSSDKNTGTNNSILSVDSESSPSTLSVSTFTDYAYHERELINFIESGRNWYGEDFDSELTKQFNFTFADLNTSKPLKIRTYVLAQASISSSFAIRCDSEEKTATISGTTGGETDNFAKSAMTLHEYVPQDGSIDVEITYNRTTASGKGWLDKIVVNAVRNLNMSGGQMVFSYVEKDAYNITEFTISNAASGLRVWDVTNPSAPSEIPLSFSGSSALFRVRTSGVHRFVAFDGSSFYKPLENQTTKVANQDLHGLTPAEMLIVTHSEFLDHANELAEFHRVEDNLRVHVVTNEQVYHEFSSGAPDVGAIRNFVRMFYERAGSIEADFPRYLLLFGDGSFDNKGYAIQEGKNTNYVLTYQSNESTVPTKSFVSDDFYGMLDMDEGVMDTESYYVNGLVDVGVGRIPVRSKEEAADVLSKIRAYYSEAAKGSWRNVICMVADDEDGNTHFDDAESLCKRINSLIPAMNVEKIYLDAYPQETNSGGNRYPEAKLALDQRIENGALIVNYLGHGNAKSLAHEQIVTLSSLQSWTNQSRLPLFITGTCEFSRFDNYKLVSAGEQVLLSPRGGGIALLTTTRLVYAFGNYDLNSNFYGALFKRTASGDFPRLGDALMEAKQKTANTINKYNFSLLGDPALRMPVPKHRAVITRLETDGDNYTLREDGNWVIADTETLSTPTIKALSRVVFSGEIRDIVTNTKMESFGATAYPLLFDKASMLRTLANDEGSDEATFNSWRTQLYRGKANVSSGNFTFEFIMPKDVNYEQGFGRLSLYVAGEDDAAGLLGSFLVGGLSDKAGEDKHGPSIELYLNDEKFVSGGTTDESPYIYALLSDSSGINISNASVGHDIMAMLENSANALRSFVLNDAYEAEKDDFRKGKVKYKLSELETGHHSLRLKAWDVYNNSSETEIDFYVVDSEELKISRLFNYPNPFTVQTWFYFEHNRPNRDMLLSLQIFTLSGKMIRGFSFPLHSTGFKPDPVYWDGTDEFGDLIGRGVYIYRLRLKDVETGETTEKMEKLLILK